MVLKFCILTFQFKFSSEAFKSEICENIDSGMWQINKKQKHARSDVWNYIYEVYDGEDRVDNAYYCNVCHKALYNFYERGNTSLFKRHACQKVDDKKVKLLIRPEIKTEFKSAAANFVSKDLRPYLAIEGEGLFDLLSTAMKFGQSYKKATIDDLRQVLPSRNTVRAHLEKEAIDIKAKIKSILQKAKEIGGFAVTSDTWTDKYRRLTYICLVAHCNIVTEKGIERHCLTLYVDQITELIKSKKVVVDYILNVLREYGFSKEDVKQFVTFVTDRGSNFKYGLISAGFDRLNCYGHLIHNLSKSMLNGGKVKEIMRTAAKVAAIVKNSNINSQITKSIKTFSSTRWNGAYTMLESIVQNFDELYSLLFQRQRHNPKQKCFDLISSLDVNEMKAVCKFLKQFKEITNDIEGDSYVTLSLVWPIYSNLKIILDEDPIAEDDAAIFSIVEEMKGNGLRYLNSRNDDFKPTMKHKIATVLNPFFKKLPAISESERAEVYGEIEECIGTRESADANHNMTESVATARTNITNIHPFFRSFYSVDDDNDNTVPPTEFETYLKHRVTTHHNNITDWWNENREQYPKLFRLFAKISSIPASSASSERVFSRAGMVVSDRRSTILPANVNNIIIARNSI